MLSTIVSSVAGRWCGLLCFIFRWTVLRRWRRLIDTLFTYLLS